MLYKIKFWTGDVTTVTADNLKDALKAAGYKDADLRNGYYEENDCGHVFNEYGDWCATASVTE